jgi:hypothetical protein
VWRADTPVCPGGYAAAGSVAIEHDTHASEVTPAMFSTLRCVKDKYLKPGGTLSLVWNNKPASSSEWPIPASVWKQPPENVPDASAASSSAGVLNLPFVGGRQSFDAPPANIVKQFDLAGSAVSVLVPPPPPCGYNPFPPCPPCGGEGLPPCVCPAPQQINPPPSCHPPTSAACAPPHCDANRFLGTDTKTQGRWQAAGYGQQGQLMFGLQQEPNSARLPPYVHGVSISHPAREGAWAALATATDPRGLAYDGSNLYHGLGFVATSSPTTSNSSFALNISSSSWSNSTNKPQPHCVTPGFTKCKTYTFEAQCEAADDPGCCHWCPHSGGGSCVSHLDRCPANESQTHILSVCALSTLHLLDHPTLGTMMCFAACRYV